MNSVGSNKLWIQISNMKGLHHQVSKEIGISKLKFVGKDNWKGFVETMFKWMTFLKECCMNVEVCLFSGIVLILNVQLSTVKCSRVGKKQLALRLNRNLLFLQDAWFKGSVVSRDLLFTTVLTKPSTDQGWQAFPYSSSYTIAFNCLKLSFQGILILTF